MTTTPKTIVIPASVMFDIVDDIVDFDLHSGKNRHSKSGPARVTLSHDGTSVAKIVWEVEE